jgi:hypothetical protein
LVNAQDLDSIILVEKKDEESELAEWSTKFINDLPNSSFAVVESCADEKKNARHLPYKDSSGKVDLPHLKNAGARMNQIKSVCGGSDDDLRAKAKKKLVPLLKKHFPNSKFAEMSEDEPENEDSSNSDEGEEMADPEKNEELSQKIEELATALNEKTGNLASKEDQDSLRKEIDALKTIKVKELAEKVVSKEIELGSLKEENKTSRIEELTTLGETVMSNLMSAYAALPAPEENKDEEPTGDPEPKATGLSEQGDEKLTDEQIEEKMAELRMKHFGHKKPRVAVRDTGSLDPETNTPLYVMNIVDSEGE